MNTTTATYTTRTDAIAREIIEPLTATGEATSADYDIDAIAAAVIGDYDDGYAVTVDEGEFWDIVQHHAR
jgi:hypothetical protein